MLSKKNANKLMYIALNLLVLGNIISVIVSHPATYFSTNFSSTFQSIEKAYFNSQYIKKNPDGWIPDEVVNTYAGVKYVQGVSPILIAPDTPPLGRYLIGLSVIFFNNPNIIVLISAVLSLCLMYALGMQVFKNSILSLIPVSLFSLEPIFKNQLIYTPLLDIMQLVFLLLVFVFFNKGLIKRALLFFILSSIFLGCFISTKFFATGLTVVTAMFFVLLYNKFYNKLLRMAYSLPLALVVLLLSYVREFVRSPHILPFLGVQKWIFIYHKSQLILPFSIWPLLLLNKWYVWYGNEKVISDSQWSISWPIITVLFLLTSFLYFMKKIKKNISLEVLIFWVISYILFFSFGQVASRYFVILIPILYIVSFYGVISFYKKIQK